MKLRWMLPAVLQLMVPLQGQAASQPAWSVDPATPGPDVPPAGASLFDEALAHAGGAAGQIPPFPFERLIARIEVAAGCSVRQACTRAVLIPLGRSLQRAAASPDFFAHPRVVVAVVGDGEGPLLLRDRLYLGYHDRAGVIEVISYNETLGRFEFQVVHNYRAGAQPRVSPARRRVCVACHQNHGPLFSRQLWQETNADPRIAAQLEQHAAIFHGVAARGNTDIANAIDDATDRSNRLALTQLLWERGCGDGEAGNGCRRGALRAALQFGLTDRRAYDGASAQFRTDVIDRLQVNARSNWPGGIAIPDADLLNRDPLAAHAEGAQQANVPAQFDPLVPRAPAEILRPEGSALADVLVKGIAEFVPAAGFAELDLALRISKLRNESARFIVSLPCALTESNRWLAFECSASGAGARLKGSLGEGLGTIDELSLQAGGAVRHLQLGYRRSHDATGRTAVLTKSAGERSLRLPDGNAVQSITLRWRPAAAGRSEGQASIKVRRDFSNAGLDLDQLQAQRRISSSAIDAAIAGLHGRPVKPCCTPQVASAEHSNGSTSFAPTAAAFEPDCGGCHHTEAITPPNFLAGDADRVERALTACAPRMFVRLAMRDRPAAAREKSPMPPEPVLLPGRQAMTNSASLRAVQNAVETRLRQSYGRVPSVDELLRQGYETLPPCLPLSHHE